MHSAASSEAAIVVEGACNLAAKRCYLQKRPLIGLRARVRRHFVSVSKSLWREPASFMPMCDRTLALALHGFQNIQI